MNIKRRSARITRLQFLTSGSTETNVIERLIEQLKLTLILLKLSIISEICLKKKIMKRQKAYIERFRASATRSTQAKSREKLLDKLDKIEAPDTETLKEAVIKDLSYVSKMNVKNILYIKNGVRCMTNILHKKSIVFLMINPH